MVRKKRKIWKLLGWILGGFIAFILLITIAFYLGRGQIMKRALVYLNENRPGEVHMGKMYLIPLMDFPHAVIQFREISLYENPLRSDSLHQEPILYIHELYVSLDILELVRGDIKVEQFRLEDGFVRLEVYEDSVMNIENALGFRFGDESGNETGSGDSTRTIDADRIEMNNILVLYHDLISGDTVNIQINRLESQFSYLPGIITAGIELNIDINKIKYQTFNIEKEEDVRFSSRILFHPESKSVDIEPSSLSILGLELETWGMYEFQGEPGINLAFRATNTGLDVLNFLFLGILDMDEIEQIGSGSIHLDGSVTGAIGEQLPVIRVNGSAQGIGFRIKSIKRDVSDISFALYATNGGKADFSEGKVELRDFTASFPGGSLYGNIRAHNLLKPELDIKLKGEMDLSGLEQMIELDELKDIQGHIRLDCRLSGVLDRSTDDFLDKAGSVSIHMESVGLIYAEDTLSDMEGTLYMNGNVVGARGLELNWNGSQAKLEVKTENILGYLLDYDRDVNIEMALASAQVFPGRLTHDTVITSLLGEELKGLHFKAEASITWEELNAFLEHDTLPEFKLSLDSFGIKLPVYADISDLNARFTFDTDTLRMHYLNGMIGGSGFSFSGNLINLKALVERDSGEMMSLDYSLSSDLMKAEDLFFYKDSFLLPVNYRTEYLDNFYMEGSAFFSADALLTDSIDMDFGLEVYDMGWQFRYYPPAIDHFRFKVRKEGSELYIENLEGKLGESKLKLNALIGNYADSSLASLYGYLELESDLLDIDQLLSYQIPGELTEPPSSDTFGSAEPQQPYQLDFPDFNLKLNIGELRYQGNTLYDIRTSLRSTKEKLVYLDEMYVAGESGGSLGLKGQFKLVNPLYYILSTELELKNFNIRDLNFEMQSGEETYSLKENFAGIVTGSGQAELFFTPDLKLNMDSSTALLPLAVKEGELIDFAPLKAAGKFMDNKDLDHVRYSTSLIRFSLADSRITIPLTVVESTIGQILIEGEQGLDNTYLYLLRVPPWLVKDAAKSALSKSKDDGKEDEIRKMKMGKFVMMTLWKKGEDSGVVTRDQREKYR